jgi:molybdate transport system substrate-binding protein
VRGFAKSRVAAAVAMALVAAGCGSSSKSSSTSTSASITTSSSSGGSKAAGSITVSAASSLTGAFTKIGTDFESANPGATAKFNFGSSSTLATQIEQGAPADAFASADTANMAKLHDKGLLSGTPEVFARNQLVIVTKPGNPKHVKSLSDLANVGTIALCGADVPCGKYAEQALKNAGVTIPESSITRGVDVKATLSSVTTGDANAAVVYVTDAKSAGSQVETVTIPAAQNVIATYPIAGLKASGQQATVQAFIAYVLSPAGQSTLQSFGFLPPS